MNLSRRRWLKMGTLLGAASLLWSCVAPILTVPPPGAVAFELTVLTASDGTQQKFWVTSGGPLEQAANATYFVLDRTVGGGVIATARNDGSFTAPPMLGSEGDQVLVYYRTPFGDYSDSLCVLLGTAASPAGCE
jgi:hypothetical protein